MLAHGEWLQEVCAVSSCIVVLPRDCLCAFIFSRVRLQVQLSRIHCVVKPVADQGRRSQSAWRPRTTTWTRRRFCPASDEDDAEDVSGPPCKRPWVLGHKRHFRHPPLGLLAGLLRRRLAKGLRPCSSKRSSSRRTCRCGSNRLGLGLLLTLTLPNPNPNSNPAP